MRWTYDSKEDALYIYVSDARPEGQVEMPDGTIVDVDAADSAVGIEVLGASAGWDVAAVIAKFHLDSIEKTLKAIATSSTITGPQARTLTSGANTLAVRAS